MSRIKVNTINPFTGTTVTLGGNVIPSGSKTLGTEIYPWDDLYVGTSSVSFVNNSITIARLAAIGETGIAGNPTGMMFTWDQNSLRGSFSVGRNNRASGTASLTVGLSNTASGNYSYAQGTTNLASGLYSHAEGSNTQATNTSAHAEGSGSSALGIGSHAEGAYTLALNNGSHAEGYFTTASGTYSHTEGESTLANGNGAHAEGYLTIAQGALSHAEGRSTISIGNSSHAEGEGTIALGFASHTEGLFTVASGSYQTVVGEYNALGDTTSYFIVGGGTSGTRKDAFKVTNSSSIVVATQSTAPSWTGVEGEMVPYVSGGVYRLYAYLGGAWRSSSFV